MLQNYKMGFGIETKECTYLLTMRKEIRYKIINKAIIIYKFMELIFSQYCMAALRIKAERKKCCRY